MMGNMKKRVELLAFAFLPDFYLCLLLIKCLNRLCLALVENFPQQLAFAFTHLVNKFKFMRLNFCLADGVLMGSASSTKNSEVQMVVFFALIIHKVLLLLIIFVINSL